MFRLLSMGQSMNLGSVLNEEHATRLTVYATLTIIGVSEWIH